jgi:hypothetical protein
MEFIAEAGGRRSQFLAADSKKRAVVPLKNEVVEC